MKTGESHSYIRVFSFNIQDVGVSIRKTASLGTYPKRLKVSLEIHQKRESEEGKGNRRLGVFVAAIVFLSYFFFLNKHHLFCVIKFPYYFL